MSFWKALSMSSLVLALFVTGCVPFSITTQMVPQGYLANKDIDIVAKDGSFTLKGGETFYSPFQSDMYGCTTCESNYLNKSNLMNPNALVMAGGQPVTVKLKNRGKELEGILVLNKVFTGSSRNTSGYALDYWQYSSPSLRSYEIAIPESRIDAALNGRTTLSYEIFAKLAAGKSATGRSREALSWILMLSRTPLTTSAGMLAPSAGGGLIQGMMLVQ